MKALALVAAIVMFSFYGDADRITVGVRQESKSPVTDRIAEIDRLRAVVRDERLRRQDSKRVTAAINRLGELKAVSAIADLISILTFRQEFSEEQQEIDIISKGLRYPAINALWQIGKPALPALSAMIASNVSQSIAAKNAVYTVMLIFRDDPKQGVDYLEDQAAKAPNQLTASRFRAAAEWTRKVVAPH